MRYLVLAALLALSACAGTLPTGPSNVAEATVLDEKIGIGAEAAYTTATKLGTALARAGLIDKAKFKGADAKAYAALAAVRTAYRAGNATSYAAAIAELYAAVADIRALVKD